MSTELTQDERRQLRCNCWRLDGVWHHRNPCLASEVERILETRETALRAQIAAEIREQCEADEPPCLGCFTAARIAEGGTGE